MSENISTPNQTTPAYYFTCELPDGRTARFDLDPNANHILQTQKVCGRLAAAPVVAETQTTFSCISTDAPDRDTVASVPVSIPLADVPKICEPIVGKQAEQAQLVEQGSSAASIEPLTMLIGAASAVALIALGGGSRRSRRLAKPAPKDWSTSTHTRLQR